MILKGSQRGGGAQLGMHLLKTEENEHVEVHEVRGFVSESVLGAMKEAQAISKGTRCRQYLFSLSLSPPQTEAVRAEVFEKALDAIEDKLGLNGQPRIVVFHEKEGRRHCHAVWSRIDAEKMTAKSLPFFKTKLRDVSKQLYLEHGWQMPIGLMDSKARDPRNFSLEEWQQAKRAGVDAAALKGMVQECWAVSDGLSGFERALEERGLFLAKGDRRGHVVLSYEGEVYALARLIDKKAKDVSAKLGSADALPSVKDVKAKLARDLAPKLSGFIREAKQIAAQALKPLEDERRALQLKHRTERDRLDVGQKARWTAETKERADRFRKGAAGLWDRLTGAYSKTKRQNEMEAFFCLQRDRAQRDELVLAQVRERHALQVRIRDVRRQNAERVLMLYREAVKLRHQAENREGSLQSTFRETARGEPRSTRGRDAEVGGGPGRSTPTRREGPKPDAGRG